MDILNEMVDGIDILINSNLQNRSFAEIVDGVIIQENNDGTYKVQINNDFYDLEVYITRKLSPYDIVKIVKQDSRLTNAFIL